MPLLTQDDIAPFATIDEAKLDAMIADASALAVLAAPCLGDEASLTAGQKAAATAVLRAVILRWNDSGSGAFQQQTAGSFSVSYNQTSRGGALWPTDITQLQNICKATADSAGGAFSVDTAPAIDTVHADVCNLNFGASWCSCGADIAGQPIYETDGA